MNKKKRRNHFASRILLENFTDEDGKLYFFDRKSEEKRILKTTPDAFYRQRGLHVVSDEEGNRDDLAEEAFAELERKAAPVFDGIITAVRDREKPALSLSEREILDRYVYFHWSSLPDMADPIIDNISERLALEYPDIDDLSHEDMMRIGKNALFETIAGDIKKPGRRLFSFIRNKSLAFMAIRRKNKSFVIGSNPVLQVFPEHSPERPDSLLRTLIAIWIPLAHDVAVAYGDGGGEVLLGELVNYRELRRFNEDIFKQSQVIAGRSDKLIASLVGVAI